MNYNFKKDELINDLCELRSKTFRRRYASYQEIADLTGMSKTTVHRFLKGEKELTVDEFLRLVDLTEKTPHDFFEWEIKIPKSEKA